MAPSVRVVGRGLLVWMVAIAAGLQTFAQSIIDAWKGHGGESLVWILTTVAIMSAAISGERLKAFLEQ